MRQFKPGQLQSGSLYPISASYALTASYLSGSISINTGSLVTTASFNAFTSSYTTGSFTGSFKGDGSQLTGIVSSKWTGSNPISRQSDVEITGSLRTRNTVGSGINTTLAQLIYSDTASVDWRNNYLKDTAGVSIDWGLRKGFDTAGTQSISWSSRAMWDENNAVSIDWTTRQLIKSDESTIVVDWENELFTGSLHGTSSWAKNAITASYIITAQTASYVLNSISSSFATSASRAVSSSFATSASWAPDTTFPYTGSAIISGSLIVTGSTNITGQTGTSIFSSNADTLVITGSILLSGSMYVSGGLVYASSSYANQALSSSFAQTASYVLNAISASFATTASFAISASYIDGGFY